MKLEISKKDWSLTKSDFCKKYGISEIEYKNINKIRVTSKSVWIRHRSSLA